MTAETTRLIEEIERKAFRALHAAADGKTRVALGLEWHEVGGVSVSIARHEPSILLNRAIGLGIEGPATRDTVEAVVARYREAGVGRYFFHLHPEAEPLELAGWMGAAGLERGRGWMKFLRLTEPMAPARSDLSCREIGAEDAAAFGRIATANFGMSEKAAPLVASLHGQPGWHLFMSFDGEVPAGTAALYLDDGIGWCDWSATDPAFRRRGSQSALLAARVAKAIELGAKLISTETGKEVPGDPQHSYHNIVKAGFREAVVRENWVPQVQ